MSDSAERPTVSMHKVCSMASLFAGSGYSVRDYDLEYLLASSTRSQSKSLDPPPWGFIAIGFTHLCHPLRTPARSKQQYWIGRTWRSLARLRYRYYADIHAPTINFRLHMHEKRMRPASAGSYVLATRLKETDFLPLPLASAARYESYRNNLPSNSRVR